jgi:hypothetical protein
MICSRRSSTTVETEFAVFIVGNAVTEFIRSLLHTDPASDAKSLPKPL